jgi:hypothetical protein
MIMFEANRKRYKGHPKPLLFFVMPVQESKLQVRIEGSADERGQIKQFLSNSSIPLEIISESPSETILQFQSTIFTISILLTVLEAKLEQIKGEVILPNGTKFPIDEKGLEEVRNTLVEVLKQPQQGPPQNLWWLYFLPELKGLLKEITSLVKWYPRAVGEGKYIVARNFTIVIGLILLGVGFLTYIGRISGDAFVFVVGIVLGYVFSFLYRFLGLSGNTG